MIVEYDVSSWKRNMWFDWTHWEFFLKIAREILKFFSRGGKLKISVFEYPVINDVFFIEERGNFVDKWDLWGSGDPENFY